VLLKVLLDQSPAKFYITVERSIYDITNYKKPMDIDLIKLSPVRARHKSKARKHGRKWKFFYFVFGW